MYGLVNQAIEELICSRHGQDAWQDVKNKAGEDIDAFVRMEAYPDSLTYGIVGAACEHLNCTRVAAVARVGRCVPR